MSTMPQHVSFIGCGNMGGALLNRWLEADLPIHFHVITPHSQPPKHARVTHAARPDEALGQSNIVLLATKPQIMDEVCPPLNEYIAPDALILSVAAGKGMDRLQSYFHEHQPIIRAMPNTPAMIGKGMTGAYANQYATDEHKNRVTELMKYSGLIEWIDDEDLMDAITAISGAGPAYVFYMIEALTQAGIANGVKPDLAATLARQTIIGAAALAEIHAETSPEILRQNVTSPGGVTEAGLKTLMDGRFQEILTRTVTNAIARGKEL